MKIKLLFIFICFVSLTSLSFAQTQEARQTSDTTNYNCEELKIHSYNFRTEMEKEEGSKGYIIVYDGKDAEGVYDKSGKFQQYSYISPKRGQLISRIQGIRGMFHFIAAPMERIKIIKGGFRDKFAIEFWLVPDGAEPPKPTPTLKKMHYRKGKMHKFIYLDC